MWYFCGQSNCDYCGNPMTRIGWQTEKGIMCSVCKRKWVKSNKRHNYIQQSKPLHPRSGQSFRPDSFQSSSNYNSNGERRKFYTDKVYHRISNKRQRRVNSYMIKLGLEQ